jgi:ABC-2 type transport system ATP-binding protein
MTEVLPRSVDGAALAVATRDLLKQYGGREVLRRVGLTVPLHSFYLLVGPNGAGKSTLLKVLQDIVRADGGRAEVLGLDCRDPLVRANVGYVPEDQRIAWGWLRVGALLAHHRAYFPSWDDAYATRLGSALGVDPRARLRHLSKGELRRVQLLMALAHRPSLLLLDEPTDGLDPVARDEVLGLLAEHLADAPATVIASTHLVYELDRMADTMGVLRAGSLDVQIGCDELQRMLRRYTLDAPDGWHLPEPLRARAFHADGAVREPRWILWGDERDVVDHVLAAGARIRGVSPLPLDEAARVLLRRRDTA